MIPILFNLLYIPAALLYLPILLYRMIALGKSRRGWAERFGGVPAREDHRPCVWIHGVSLGEINATRSLVTALRDVNPAIDVCVSSTTDTGIDAATRLYPDLLRFRFPLDFSFCIRRTLRRVRPSMIVLIELELWPNFLEVCARDGITVAVANGRITEEKSMRRYRLPLISSIANRMVSQLAWIAAQDDTYAARFETLGVPAQRIHTVGSIKYDTASIVDTIDGEDDLAAALGFNREAPLIVAGSTGPGEEEMLLDAFDALRRINPTIQLAIVPRKPERFDEVARLIDQRGFACVRRSQRPEGTVTEIEIDSDKPTVILGDTMGELRKFYSLASIVFVGRSLVPMGGSDLMEVAALAKPMLYGPHVWNFEDIDRQLMQTDAARKVEDARELALALQVFINDVNAGDAMGQRARDVVRRNQGATAAIMRLICSTLPTDDRSSSAN